MKLRWLSGKSRQTSPGRPQFESHSLQAFLFKNFLNLAPCQGANGRKTPKIQTVTPLGMNVMQHFSIQGSDKMHLCYVIHLRVSAAAYISQI